MKMWKLPHLPRNANAEMEVINLGLVILELAADSQPSDRMRQ